MTLDLRPVLDFAQSFDPASSDEGRIQEARALLARQIVVHAARCRNNRELLDGLYAALSPENGFAPLRLRGTGTTRQVWDLPFGMVLKTVRSDPEQTWAHNPGYLSLRRSVATFTEFVAAIHLPLATPRIYGVLFAFGKSPSHPAVNISASVEPLPGDRTTFVEFDDLYISGDTGRLLAKGVHFRNSMELKPTDRCLTDLLGVRGSNDPTIYTENLGVDSDGNYLLIDTGNFMAQGLHQNLRTLMPVGLEEFPVMSDDLEASLGFFMALYERVLRRALERAQSNNHAPSHHTGSSE